MADEDAELMRRAAAGDEQAFASLFERHYARAVNIAYRSTGDADLAEDIAMEAFARVYESRRFFRGSAKFST
ncbi:MAG: RNA polymerase sigma factor, partial [Armatimonadota bacterium]